MSTEQIKKPTLPSTNFAYAESLGLSKVEWDQICKGLSRTPNEVECLIFSVLWSEELSRKNSIEFLRAISSIGDGESLVPILRDVASPAGPVGVRLNDGTTVTLSLGSSRTIGTDPYYGASAGWCDAYANFGSIGAEPLASLQLLHFGDAESTVTHHRFQRTVNGLSWAGNTHGVPVASSHCYFHTTKEYRSLLNIGFIGTVPSAGGETTANTPGSPVVYLGLKTGLDGLPREQRSGESNTNRPRMADPFLDQELRSLLQEVLGKGYFSQGVMVGSTGLLSALVTLQDRVQAAFRIDLNKVPTTTPGMKPGAILQSATPHRLLAVIPKQRYRAGMDLLTERGFEVVTIGELLESEYFEIAWHHKEIAVVPYPLLARGAPEKRYQFSKSPPMVVADPEQGDLPEQQRKAGVRRGRDDGATDDWASLRTAIVPGTKKKGKQQENSPGPTSVPDSIEDSWVDLLAALNLCSRTALLREFDQTAAANTVSVTDGDVGVFRLKNGARGVGGVALAAHISANPLFVAHDPYLGTIQTVARGYQRIVSSGARPIAAGYSLNFGNVEDLETVASLAEVSRGIRVACEAWKLPIIGDAVSFAGPKESEIVPPTPAIVVIGVLDDYTVTCNGTFQEKEDVVFLLGETRDELGCSEYRQVFYKRLEGGAPDIDFDIMTNTCDGVRELIGRKLLRSARSIDAGGIAVAVAASCVGGARGLGATIKLRTLNAHKELTPETLLFAESPSRFVISCKPTDSDTVKNILEERRIPIAGEGKVGGSAIEIASFSIPLATASRIWTCGLDHLYGRAHGVD